MNATKTLYLTKEQASKTPHLTRPHTGGPVCYEVWGERETAFNFDTQKADTESVLLASYWNVRDALTHADQHPEASCDCEVIAANGLEFDDTNGAFYLRSDVKCCFVPLREQQIRQHTKGRYGD